MNPQPTEIPQATFVSYLMNRGLSGRPSHFTLHSNRLYYLKPSEEGANVLNVLPLSKSSRESPKGSSVLLTLNNLASRPMTKAEALLRERQRLPTQAILSYSFHEVDGNKGKILISSGGSIFIANIEADSQDQISSSLIEVETWKSGEATDVKLSPDMNFVSFVREGNLFLSDMSSTIYQLSFADRSREITCGVAEFILQEEFDRYTGYAWAPLQSILTSSESSPEKAPNNLLRICYFEVDESSVEKYHITTPGFKGEFETFRYPRTGTNNATSELFFVEFEQNNPSGARRMKLKQSLKKGFPWFEYIPRFGWTPDHRIWLQLLDRLQQRMLIVAIPLTEFVSVDDISDFENHQLNYSIIHEEQTLIWYNVGDIIHFFGKEDGPKYENKVLISSEQDTGFRKLYLIDLKTNTKKMITVGEREDDNTDNQVECVKKDVEMTEAHQSDEANRSKKRLGWEVGKEKVWIDQVNDLVYFTATKDSPLETHLYVSSLFSDPCLPPQRLTKVGYTHSVTMNKEATIFSTTFSSVESIFQTELFEVVHHSKQDNRQNERQEPNLLVEVKYLATLDVPLKPPSPNFPQITPELLSFVNSKGDTIFGAIYKPKDFDQTKKYPALLYVYGGPHVQLVSNSYSMVNTKWSLMAHLGYIVLCFDTYGSFRRGLEFEGAIREKMGTVEAEGQVDALKYVLNQGFIDPSRVGVTGWSYGGYLSLVLYAKYSEVFKVAIPGAPVTFWEAYDTGYTERYMNLPENNRTGYENSSVLALAPNFPSRPDSLLLVHGMIDENVHFCHTSSLIEELNRFQKPYTIQLYPDERHGIRKARNSSSWEMKFFNFVLKNL